MPAHDDGDIRGARPTSVRTPVPPPGRNLDFDAWCRLLTDELRRRLPEVKATTNGRDRVTWRYDGKEVTAHNDRGCYMIRLDPRFGGLQDAERHDEHTATTCALTVAGFFDARFTRAENP
jgi:hypothetical protein